MPRARRLTALLIALLSLQIVSLAAGWDCAPADVAVAGHEHETPRPDREAPAAPCEDAGLRVGCEGVSACVPLGDGGSGVVAGTIGSARASHREPSMRHTGPVSPPESPPPRA